MLLMIGKHEGRALTKIVTIGGRNRFPQNQKSTGIGGGAYSSETRVIGEMPRLGLEVWVGLDGFIHLPMGLMAIENESTLDAIMQVPII